MSGWKPKRFWNEVDVVAEPEGTFGIRLDGKPVRTPAKNRLSVPTRSLADCLAREWQAQEGVVEPATMPFTRMANAAIDKVRIQKAEVAAMLAAYGDTDLLYYRADRPSELIRRQVLAWDPLLNRCETELGVKLEVRTGIVHRPQPRESLDQLSRFVNRFSSFELAALHDLVTLSGSLVIALAAVNEWAKPDELWLASRVDEIWQEEQWGIDEEAAKAAERKKREFFHAACFFRKCQRP